MMNIRKTLLIVGIITLVLGLVLGCATGANRVAEPFAGNPSGRATGTAPGYGGPVEVTVTMEAGFITEVVIRGDQETPAFAQPVFMRAPRDMVRDNSAQIDIIAGSTVTTQAVISAAQSAINQIIAGQ